MATGDNGLLSSIARQALLERVGARLRSPEQGWERVEPEVAHQPTFIPSSSPSEEINARRKVVHPVGEKPTPEREQQIDKYLTAKLKGGWFWHRYYAWRYGMNLESVEVMNHLQAGLQRLHDWSAADNEASLTPSTRALVDVLQCGEVVGRLTYYFKAESPYRVFQQRLNKVHGAFAEERYVLNWMEKLEGAYQQVTRWLKGLLIKQPIWVRKEAKVGGQPEYHIRVGKGPEVTLTELKTVQTNHRTKRRYDVNTYTRAWNYRCMQVMKGGLHNMAKGQDVERGKEIFEKAGDLMLGRLGEKVKRTMQRAMPGAQPHRQKDTAEGMLTQHQRAMSESIDVQNGTEDWDFNIGDYYDLCRQQDREALRALEALSKTDSKSDDFEERLVQVHKLWRSSREAYIHVIKHCAVFFDRSEEWRKIQCEFFRLQAMLEDNGQSLWVQLLTKQGVESRQAETLVGLTRAVLDYHSKNIENAAPAYRERSQEYDMLVTTIKAQSETRGSVEAQLAVDAYVRRLEDWLGPQNGMKSGISTLWSNQEYILFAREDYQYAGAEGEVTKVIVPKDVMHTRHRLLSTPAERANAHRLLLTQGDDSKAQSNVTRAGRTDGEMRAREYGANGRRYWHGGEKKDIPLEQRRYPRRVVNLYGIFGVPLGDFEGMKTKWKKEIRLQEHPDKAPRVNLELIECPEPLKHVYDDLTDRELAKELQDAYEAFWLEDKKGYAKIENEFQQTLTTLCFRRLNAEYEWFVEQGPECYIDKDEDEFYTLQGALDYLNRSHDDMWARFRTIDFILEAGKISDEYYDKRRAHTENMTVRYTEMYAQHNAKLDAAQALREAPLLQEIARLEEIGVQINSDVAKIQEGEDAQGNKRQKLKQLNIERSLMLRSISGLHEQITQIRHQATCVAHKVSNLRGEIEASRMANVDIPSEFTKGLSIEQLEEKSKLLIDKVFSEMLSGNNRKQTHTRCLSITAYGSGESSTASLASTPASSVDLLLKPRSRSNSVNGVN